MTERLSIFKWSPIQPDGHLGPQRERQIEKVTVHAAERNAKTLLGIFSAIEHFDLQRMRELVDPEFEIYWPPSLPYGGSTLGIAPKTDKPTWMETWAPLQPTERERSMDPRVVAASGDEVVVLWRQRGIDSSEGRFDCEVLGLYRFRCGKLARAQMFYFDTAAVANFLANSTTPERDQRARSAFHRFESLGDDRRIVVGRAYERLRILPSDRRREALHSGELKAQLCNEERHLLVELLALNLGHGREAAEMRPTVQPGRLCGR